MFYNCHMKRKRVSKIILQTENVASSIS